MFRKLLGLSVFLLPFTMSLPASYAESWQQWSQQNPTYRAPTPTPSTPAPARPSSPSPSQVPPKTWSSPSPKTRSNGHPLSSEGSSNHEYYSTQNPLFEQQFLAGCEQNQLLMSFCQCSLKEVQNTYTYDEVVQIADYMNKNGELPTEIVDVALKCLPG